MTNVESVPPALESKALCTAARHHVEGRLQPAILLLERALPHCADRRAVLEALVRLRMESRLYAEALAAIQDLQSSGAASPEVWHWQGVCLEKNGKWKDAAGAFTESLRLSPGRTASLIGLGICLLRTGDPEKALLVFDQVLATESANRLAFLGKGVALQLLNRLEEARAHYTRHATAQDQGLFSEGWASDNGEPDPERLARAAAAAEPAFEGLISTALAAKDIPEALQYAVCLTEVAPERFEGWFYHGLCQQKLGQTEQAAASYSRTLALNPECGAAWLNLGVVQAGQGNLERAIESLGQARKFAADRAAVLMNLGSVFALAGRHTEAAQVWAELTELAPSADAWFHLGLAQLECSRDAGARESFARCLTLDPAAAPARFNLGLAFLRDGHPGEAAQAFEAVLENEPDHQGALQALAALAMEQKNYSRALELQNRLLEKEGASAELLFNAGILMQQMERTQDSAEYYRRALLEDPTFVEALVNLGHVLQASGDAQAAAGCWSKALELRPDLAQEYFSHHGGARPGS